MLSLDPRGAKQSPSKCPPTVGDPVQVRSRRWLVEEVIRPEKLHQSPLVRLACADDAQGQSLDVFWEYELDRRILEEEGWQDLAAKGFDAPRQFAAFLHALRWNCVTATDPNLFQAPFRAGIKIDAYQMEPLRKALRLPRVNLFIADDTGLGKTIEAGLIARELLLRKKAKTIVVVAPPSVLEQWKAELEERFGLVFFDTLRAPRKQNEKVANWRREAPIRPVVFEDTGVLTEDTVHLHLEQRVAQRLLARFRSQGFIHHDLSRACLAQVADSIPRVVLLSRLSLYGQGAERLHEELVPLAARWIEPSQRKGPLTPYAREAEAKTLDLLEHSLGSNGRRPPDEAIQRKLLTATPRDIEELLPQLEPRAEELALLAIDKLRKRGEREEKDLPRQSLARKS